MPACLLNLAGVGVAFLMLLGGAAGLRLLEGPARPPQRRPFASAVAFVAGLAMLGVAAGVLVAFLR